ncbi:thioesterase domain-containing protein/acyl carrier protein [Pseudorhizobium tarimense]|uniref:Thioesterase domain-containing protein/acyl carrier protein n=1 Tax=Pseudorhizobium tarimense TaxID=1079109 RepID=A0ABV2H4P8_9HYPH|nr:condensation domain-containing protein [Pseudorhizobium tarimense]MCJ8518621.1 condensation domain-containing protein [Pseudorhizobium tarimense]
MNQLETQADAPTIAAQVVGEFPCTQTQLRCWVLDQLQPGNPALNVAVRWEIRGMFKASTIEAAFRKIIQRHEILRTRFVERQGSPHQQVLEAVDFKLSVIDLRSIPAEQREERIVSIGEETASAPFDLERGGLFRVTLLMVENNRAFLLITAHQTCFDGWSIRVLGRELGEIASAMEAGRAPLLPDLPLQYGDFALWQQEYLSSYGFEAERGFWKETLADAPYFEVPSDHPRPAVKTTSGDIISAVKPLEFGERIEAAARDHKVSLFTYGVAVVSAALHRVTGARDILFGTQIAGREHSDLEPMIGVFINNMVLRLPVQPQASFEDHLYSAKQTVSAAVNHQRMPFNKLVECINPVRDPSRNPLISVNFNLSKAFLEDRRYGDFELISAPSQSPGVVYDISFGMVGRPSGWRMSIEYNTDLFDRSTIEHILRLWQDVYEQALNTPSAPLLAERIKPQRSTPSCSVDTGTPTDGVRAAATIEHASSDPENVSTLSQAECLRLLGEIWAKVLDVDKVTPEGNFFTLGGHSLLALRMLSAVRGRFGIKPELTLLFKEPTLRGFATALFGGNDPEVQPQPLARALSWNRDLYKEGMGTAAIYTINHPFLYFQLANRLSDEISVYNVNMFGTSPDEMSVDAKLEDVAASAIRAMAIPADTRRVGVVGLCVNGILALEIARQLRQSGVEVAFTAAIDAWAPGYFRSQPWLRQRLWNGERRIKRAIYFIRKLMTGRMKTSNFLKEFRATQWLGKAFAPREQGPSQEETANVLVTNFLVRTAKGFKPEPVGELLLYRSEASPPRARKLLFGWSEAVAGKASVIDLEGWHEDSLSVNGMHRLASSIEERLMVGKS